jgi:hypothetical protein
MKRALLMMGCAIALLVGTPANAATRIEKKGMDVALGDLRKDSRVTVTTEQAPTDPSVPLLATRVQVTEMVIAAPAPASESAAGTARVESAGTDGGRPVHTAQVQSADYDEAQRPTERLPKTPTPLPLIAVIGAGFLASGLVLRLRRRPRRARRAG